MAMSLCSNAPRIPGKDGVLSMRGILRIALTALLLIAQQAALTHPLHHLGNLAGSESQQTDKAPATDSTLCGFHASFAEILGAVSAAALPLRLAANVFERVVSRDAPQLPATPVAFRSRGPPVLL